MLTKILACVIITGVMLIGFVKKQNQLTRLRLEIPILEKSVRNINEENWRLKYAIEQFEQPVHLIELSRKPEFSHLKHPYLEEIVILPNEH